MKKILVIGSSEKLGSTITKILHKQNFKMFLTHSSQSFFENSKKFDLFEDKIENIFDLSQIDLVIFDANVP